ncbi:TPA: hypothetical protein L6A34_31330 [Pseudomonas aeruginosa]|uniref:hypothetical protein n=1 Tax=Pseudomonas aeruginosa TaxID=287 RepID=UPI00071C149F|nr:hypothetical protein [Pseudomonas aeruginosa]ELQ8317567.1 hypothetical protein [Pseudomonas aeruginosa]KSM65105.1 hypothetical protein APA70_22180 [Pseudomonas aeruginosa]HBP5961579.1 hypothetical protein [Pseudomonas aeruginosa]HBP6298940.1 hypothetical protein [Pseudomonas aeruginosa]HBP6386414.1 hypothetical protein [Pseudomonas aeruginosa]
MIDFIDDLQPPLSDAEVVAGALPGESWEQARGRMARERYESVNQSALSGLECQRLVDLTEAILEMCIETLRHLRGESANLLMAKVLNLFEYCCALTEGRTVELIPRSGSTDGLIDEMYVLLSRLSPKEAEGISDSLIGLLDVLGHPEPYDNLLNLEEDGALKMVLRG